MLTILKWIVEGEKYLNKYVLQKSCSSDAPEQDCMQRQNNGFRKAHFYNQAGALITAIIPTVGIFSIIQSIKQYDLCNVRKNNCLWADELLYAKRLGQFTPNPPRP
jgi:hypothetical protein